MLTLIISALILAALIGVAAGYWLRKRDEEPDTVRDVAPITQRSNWYTGAIDDDLDDMQASGPWPPPEPIRLTPNGTPISQTGYQK